MLHNLPFLRKIIWQMNGLYFNICFMEIIIASQHQKQKFQQNGECFPAFSHGYHSNQKSIMMDMVHLQSYLKIIIPYLFSQIFKFHKSHGQNFPQFDMAEKMSKNTLFMKKLIFVITKIFTSRTCMCIIIYMYSVPLHHILVHCLCFRCKRLFDPSARFLLSWIHECYRIRETVSKLDKSDTKQSHIFWFKWT